MIRIASVISLVVLSSFRFVPPEQPIEIIQDSKNILVVPFNRFEFHTEYSLDEIAEANEVDKAVVYDLYRGKLLNTIAGHSCENYKFKIINSTDLSYLSRRVQYKFERKPERYYASDLSMLSETDLQRILKAYDAEFIFFLNWYTIKKDVLVGLGTGDVSMNYSYHYVDYDVYNNTKQKLVVGHKFKIEQQNNKETVMRKGLRVSDLSIGFQGLAEKICTDLIVSGRE